MVKILLWDQLFQRAGRKRTGLNGLTGTSALKSSYLTALPNDRNLISSVIVEKHLRPKMSNYSSSDITANSVLRGKIGTLLAKSDILRLTLTVHN